MTDLPLRPTVNSAPGGSAARDKAPSGLIIAVLAAAGMSVSLQQTLVIPLVPNLPAIFGTSVDTASWLVTITLLSGAVATPIVTKLADMHGKRKMIILALSVMVLGSLILAVSTSLVLGLIGRALQGLAAAVIPIGISILRDELPKERVGFGIALMSATLGIGGALGLPLSGLLYESMGWASLFWVSATVTTVILAATILIVPESPVRSPGSFDITGAVVLSIALTTLLLVISKGSSWGWTSAPVAGLAVACLVTFMVWVPLQLRIGEPMVDLRTAATRPVLLTNIASVLVTMGMMANGLLTVPLVEAPASSGYGLGLSVMDAGLVMAPSGLVMVLFAPVSGWLLGRIGGRWMLIMGAAITSVSYLLRPALSGSIPEIMMASTLGGLGAAIAFAAMPALIMSAVPITETASANGINALMRSVGMATASAGTAAIFATWTMTVEGGAARPSEAAYEIGFILFGVLALVAAVVAAFIPARRGVGAIPESGEGHERVIRGRLVLGPGLPLQVLGTVVLTRTDGQQVDWARPDFDGGFALALPRAGRYLVIGTARGWAPEVMVTDLSERGDEVALHLTHRLTVHGRVTLAGEAVPGATVTMFHGAGEHVGHTTADDDGEWSFPLPPTGLYLVAAALPDDGYARAEKVQVDSESVQVDIDLTEPAIA